MTWDINNRSKEGTTIVRTTSAYNCGGRCLLRLHIKDNKIIRVEGDDAAEPNQLRACLRCRALRKQVHHPDRLLYPQKRVGEKGEGRFERISWDEALKIIARELRRVKDHYGNESILLASGGGYIASLHAGLRATSRLLSLFGGFTGHYGNVSSEGPIWAAQVSFGTPLASHSLEDLVNSNLILMWGWDPARIITGTNTMYHLIRAREAGARVVSIDPRYHDSAAIVADQWVPIRPGTDVAMMAAMAYVMIQEGLHDQKFLDTYTVGFPMYRDDVMGGKDGLLKSPVWAAQICGVEGETIARLAREYATTKPAALLDAHGPPRSAMGEQFSRGAIVLAAMTGNIGQPGGGVAAGFPILPFGNMAAAPMFPGVKNPVEAGGASLRGSIDLNRFLERRIHTNRIFDAIIRGKSGGYPADIKLAWFLGCNYLGQLCHANRAAKALENLEFCVVSELFLTPTARYADIILPVTSVAERNDLTRPWPSGPYYTAINRAVEPMGECRSDLEIATALAEQLGFQDFNPLSEDEWLNKMIKENPETGPQITDCEKFRREGIHRIQLPEPYVAFKDQIKDPQNCPFPTPSGKIEVYSQRVADFNDPTCPPIPIYLKQREDHTDPLREKYPLQLLSPHPRNRVHSDMGRVDWLVEVEQHHVWINPVDAAVRGIVDGDEVLVFNDRGRLAIRAWLTERIMPGVVCIFEGGWYEPDEKGVCRGGCVNVLTYDGYTRGGASTFNNALVQIKPMETRASFKVTQK